MCNQLPSGSIFTASQILGLLVSLADLDGSLGRQPSKAYVKPKLMSAIGNSLTRCTSLFIYLQYHFGSAVLTNPLDTLGYKKGAFLRCHNALDCQENLLFWVFYVDCIKGGGKETVICALYHPVAFTFSFPHILCPTLSQKACRFVPLPHVLVRFIIKGGGTFWHLSISECCWLFVRWKLNHILRKTALQQLSPFMYCNVKAHYSWPICTEWQITFQTSVCTSYLDLLIHTFHLWCTAMRLCVSAVCF